MGMSFRVIIVVQHAKWQTGVLSLFRYDDVHASKHRCITLRSVQRNNAASTKHGCLVSMNLPCFVDDSSTKQPCYVDMLVSLSFR